MDYPNLIPENNQPRATASDRTEPTFRHLDMSDLPHPPTKPSFFTPGSAALTKLLVWIVAILLSVAFWLFFVVVAFGHTGAPGGKSLPGRLAFGFSVSADPGPSFCVIKNSEHISDFQIVSVYKLKVGMSSLQARMHGMGNVIAKECLGTLQCTPHTAINQHTRLAHVLHNCYVCLHLCNQMDIKKQHIVLNLIRSGRYTLDASTGDVISHIGKEPRVLKPIKHYSGYLQYILDIGFNDRINVYGQGFAYLARWMTTYDPKYVIDHKDRDKSNNRPDNLQCITEQQNTAGNFHGQHGVKPGTTRLRLPDSAKEEIREGHKLGMSFVRLAKAYKTTRQTVAKICMSNNSQST